MNNSTYRVVILCVSLAMGVLCFFIGYYWGAFEQGTETETAAAEYDDKLLSVYNQWRDKLSVKVMVNGREISRDDIPRDWLCTLDAFTNEVTEVIMEGLANE